jgi:hypothetical protein
MLIGDVVVKVTSTDPIEMAFAELVADAFEAEKAALVVMLLRSEVAGIETASVGLLGRIDATAGIADCGWASIRTASSNDRESGTVT